jgi:murein DD-endopeptidase MepM/ murein hydrolase activator NlpD
MRVLLIVFLLSNILFSQIIESSTNSPLNVLSSKTLTNKNIKLNDKKIEFDPKWVDSLKLVLPCENIKVPKRAMRLPNAPRNYRNGVHKGIDFFANWGTPVRAVAKGTVIRSDLFYEEVPAEFRENMLESSARVGNTPSDIFNSILLGKAVFLDHGFSLVPGFRVISIYAHLSHIDKKIKPGYIMKSGELMGNSGNTGMRESTLGSRSGSHLHWEMILQKDKDEIYLGRNLENPELFNMLTRIFE